MTNKLVKKLDEAMSADYGEDYAAKFEKISHIKREIFATLHPDQQKAIREAYTAIALVTNSYRELCHPSYDDVVSLDNSFWHLRNAFSMDEE